MTSEWLCKLKRGDKVYIDSSRFGERVLTLTTVKNVTPKGHIRVMTDALFRNGRNKIDSRTFNYLVEYTPELEKKLKAEAILSKKRMDIYGTNWHNVSIDKINRIYNILKELEE